MHPVAKWFLTSRAVESWILRAARCWLALIGAAGLACAFVLIGRGACDVLRHVEPTRFLVAILAGIAFALIVIGASVVSLVVLTLDGERQAEDENL